MEKANADYIIGYHIVKEYLAKSKKSIAEAIITPSEEIIRVSEFFN